MKGGKGGLGHHMGVSWGALAHFTSNTYPVNCRQVLRYSAAKIGNFRFSAPLIFTFTAWMAWISLQFLGHLHEP